MTISYDGTDYQGFQRQPGYRTIQGELEAALAEVLQESVAIVAAGRTDAGVHALGQVVSLRTPNAIPAKGLTIAMNRQLPVTIRVRRAWEAPADFHARRSGRWRRYWYLLGRMPVSGPDPFGGRFCWQVKTSLDLGRMQAALRAIEGRHDFTSFCHGMQAITTRRRVFRASLDERGSGCGSLLVLDVKADAFLHQMMRLLTANLVRIGAGEKPVGWLAELLEKRARHEAGVAAPPQGLWLMYVGYGPGMRSWNRGDES